MEVFILPLACCVIVHLLISWCAYIQTWEYSMHFGRNPIPIEVNGSFAINYKRARILSFEFLFTEGNTACLRKGLQEPSGL